MDHHEIEKHGIAIRYLLGLLPVEERIRFEEHYIDCEACLDRMDLVEDCCQAMQKAAAEKAAPSSVRLPARRPGRLAQLRPRWQTALLLGAVLLLALSSLLVLEIRRLRHELNQVKVAAVRQPAPPPISIKPEPPLAGAGEPSLQTVAPKSAQTRPQPASPQPSPPHIQRDKEPSPLFQPEANTPIFTLSSVRGAESSQAGLVNKIEIPNSSRWIVFSLELDGEPEYQTYRATISTAGGGRVWRESRLRPNHDGALTVSFPAAFFRAGDYLLALEGLTAERQFVAVASYPFRAIKENPLK
ncbi:MAG: hypothetical protein ACREEM_02065 [Blastocatellia bacterium]